MKGILINAYFNSFKIALIKMYIGTACVILNMYSGYSSLFIA